MARIAKSLLGKPVLVDWVDSVTVGPWVYDVRELLDENLHLTACGTLTALTEDRLVVSGARGKGGHAGSVIIPLAAVVGVRALQERPRARGASKRTAKRRKR